MTPKCLLCTCSEARIVLREIQRGLLVSALKSEHSNLGEREEQLEKSDAECCSGSM